GEDLLERRATQAALAGSREAELPLGAAADELAFLELRHERLEVDRRVDHPLALQALHPLEGLLDVAAGRQQQLLEEAHEVHPLQELLQELGVEVGVAVPHRVKAPKGRWCTVCTLRARPSLFVGCTPRTIRLPRSPRARDGARGAASGAGTSPSP